MNKWLYRAVGVASGALLLSSGVAHAEAVNESKVDPQAMRGLLADLFTPTGGQHHLGLSIDSPTSRVSTGLLAEGPDATQPATGRVAYGTRSVAAKDVFVTSMLPDLKSALPTTKLLDRAGNRNELLPGLGLIGGAAGNGGLLGGLTGGAGGSGLVGGLTGGLTGGGGSGLLGGLTGGLTGGDGPLGGLTGGLTGGDGPLGGLTGGLTGGDGPLGGLTGGLTGSDGPLGAITGGLAGTPLGGLTSGLGGDRAGQSDDLMDIDADTFQQLLAAADQNRLGQPGPVSTDIVDPALRGTALDTSNQRPVNLDPALARQVNDATGPMLSALIADAMAKQTPLDLSVDDTMAGFGQESYEEGLPLVQDLPLVGALAGPGGPLAQFLVVGDMFNNLPLVGGLTNGDGLDLAAIDRLPVVGSLLNQGLLKTDGPSLPIVGGLPFIGPALNGLTEPLTNATGGLTQGGGPLGSLTGGLTQGGPLGSLTGGLTQGGPLGGLTGGLAQGGPLGSLTGGLTQGGPLGSLSQGGPLGSVTKAPVAQAKPAPVAIPGQAPARQGIQRPAPKPASADTVGKHRAPTDTTRPTVADPEYTEESGLPLVGQLTGGGGGALPVTSLVRQLPLASELPLVGQLPLPMDMLRSLPLVGMVFGLLPIE